MTIAKDFCIGSNDGNLRNYFFQVVDHVVRYFRRFGHSPVEVCVSLGSGLVAGCLDWWVVEDEVEGAIP